MLLIHFTFSYHVVLSLKCMEADHVTHQSLQDPLALVVGAVVGQDAPVDQNQAVQEQPGAEPEQSEHQGPPTGPEPEAQPPQQAQPAAAATPSPRHQASREHVCTGGSELL